jgi:hypothetical protein
MRLGGRDGFLFLGSMAPRDRRAILLGLAILVPSFVWVLGVRPYRAALANVRESVEVERDRLRRELDLLASSTALPSAMEEVVQEAARVQAQLVGGGSVILAEAALTDFLEAEALQCRVLLEEIRSGGLERGEEPPADLELIRLHLRGESDLEGVLNFLDRMERSQLLLRVRGLALEPEMARAESNGRDDESPRPSLPTGVVRFQLILDGFASLTEHEP